MFEMTPTDSQWNAPTEQTEGADNLPTHMHRSSVDGESTQDVSVVAFRDNGHIPMHMVYGMRHKA